MEHTGINLNRCNSSVVSKNNIHDMVYTGTGSFGGIGLYMYLDQATSDITIKNNFIRHIAGDGDNTQIDRCPRGIYINGSSGASGVDIFYNSVYLTQDLDYGLNEANAYS